MVLDTIGELAQVYQIATAVFVGGSLVDTGGHNILEPAVFGKPIVFGPHMQNFKEIAEAFVAQDAAVQVTGARGLEEALLALLTDPVRRARLGAAARALVESNRGAKDKSLADHRAAAAAAGRVDGSRAPLPRGQLTRLLNLLYSQLARARRRYYQRRPHLRRRLTAPVISIGNLTVGGSGKTPLAAEIARMLLEMGERPSILSRGYARKIVGRRCGDRQRWQPRARDVERSGDEPQMLARAVPRAAVLVSSSRYLAGRIAESRLGCTVHVLDDGFQHFDLMRDVDLLVSPDASEGTRTLPFGRLREPLDAASAADALLVETTVSDTCRALSVRTRLRCVKPTFTFSRRLAGPAPDRPAFAFAGIARPERFFGDLEKAGWKLTGRRSFGDHHHYSRSEIEELARAAKSSGAEVILTTEKDIGAPGAVASARFVAVPLEITIEPAFAPWLAERLRAVRAPGAA